MHEDIKELVDAMERGYTKIPHMNRLFYFQTNESQKIMACCAIGHAYIGKTGAVYDFCETVNSHKLFPVLGTQMVTIDGEDKPCTLWGAITRLNDHYLWTTPQIVEWLRSYQKD